MNTPLAVAGQRARSCTQFAFRSPRLTNLIICSCEIQVKPSNEWKGNKHLIVMVGGVASTTVFPCSQILS